jgi:branched-chain amino acid transport system ATP-binding protein
MRLRLERIRAGYGPFEVLFGVDLVVPNAKTVALLGANGAGKTTLLKVAAGRLRPTGGEIWLDDQRVDHLPDHRRARLGMCLIPEGRGIFPQLTVRQNLAMFARGRNVADAVERASAVFPILGERLGQEATTLSGGQQQMLAMARAFVTDARVILADEPSLGLAPLIVDEIFAAIETLRAEGRSLLIVEQYVSRVLDVVDYAYVLHKGTVVFVGEPEQCRDQTLFQRYLGSVA